MCEAEEKASVVRFSERVKSEVNYITEKYALEPTGWYVPEIQGLG